MGGAGGIRSRANPVSAETQVQEETKLADNAPAEQAEPVVSERVDPETGEVISADVPQDATSTDIPMDTATEAEPVAANPIKERFNQSREKLKDTGVISGGNPYIEVVRRAMVVDPHKAEELLSRLEQGDEAAEQEFYDLAERAESMGLAENNIEDAIDNAKRG